MATAKLQIIGQLGKCGDRQVFMGFEKASILAKVSFADILDETTGLGYQRRFNRQHSLEFKRYIQREGASTIPLTFNLRPELQQVWAIVPHPSLPGIATLEIEDLDKAVMAQVDCQHRLGYLGDSNVEFAFMTYVGLSVAEEMEIFRDINGKAKGLSSSLLDFTEARIVGDVLPTANPELYHAMQLSQNSKSPWYKKLDLGGQATVGTKRIASLRTMQNAVRRFLNEAHLNPKTPHEVVTETLINFWQAVVFVAPSAWEQPRQHLITKGIGVYCLMSIAGDLVREANDQKRDIDLDYFIEKLSDFLDQIDWSNQGPLKGYGGAGGADAALELLRHTRESLHGGLNIYGKQEYSVN